MHVHALFLSAYTYACTTKRFTRAEDGSGRKFRLQEPGEEGGQFYSLWKTPLSQLGDFGVGVGCVLGSGELAPLQPLCKFRWYCCKKESHGANSQQSFVDPF